MIKRIAPFAAIVAAMLASAALPAAAQAQSAPQVRETYRWLHPKLGIVKVDRATGVLVHPQSATAQTAQTAQSANSAAVSEGARHWLDPKSNVRGVTTQTKTAA